MATNFLTKDSNLKDGNDNTCAPPLISSISPSDAMPLQASNNDIENLVRTMKALSHGRRLKILLLLASGPMSVTAIIKESKLRQASVSQSLARLRHDRLIVDYRHGRRVSYMINSYKTGKLIEAIKHLYLPGVM